MRPALHLRLHPLGADTDKAFVAPYMHWHGFPRPKKPSDDADDATKKIIKKENALTRASQFVKAGTYAFEATPGANVAEAPTANTEPTNRLRKLADEIECGEKKGKYLASLYRAMLAKRDLYNHRATKMETAIKKEQNNLKALAEKMMAQRGDVDALTPSTADYYSLVSTDAKDWKNKLIIESTFKVIAGEAERRANGALLEMKRISRPPSRNCNRFELGEAIREIALLETMPEFQEQIADIIDAFIVSPQVMSQSFVNFVLMGKAGVGKTRLAGQISRLVGALGLFVYKEPCEATRSTFVGQYLGETAPQTQSFLLRNLEHVIFLDEAYSLTTYDTKDLNTRQLDQYSQEAITEIVRFLSENVGQLSFIVAGYAEQMNRDFLAANDGLARRFPYTVHMNEYKSTLLTKIFIEKVSEALSTPKRAYDIEEVRSFFTEAALMLLEDVIDASRERPVYTYALYLQKKHELAMKRLEDSRTRAGPAKDVTVTSAEGSMSRGAAAPPSGEAQTQMQEQIDDLGFESCADGGTHQEVSLHEVEGNEAAKTSASIGAVTDKDLENLTQLLYEAIRRGPYMPDNLNIHGQADLKKKGDNKREKEFSDQMRKELEKRQELASQITRGDVLDMLKQAIENREKEEAPRYVEWEIYPQLAEFFMPQAGAMTNLANVVAVKIAAVQANETETELKQNILTLGMLPESERAASANTRSRSVHGDVQYEDADTALRTTNKAGQLGRQVLKEEQEARDNANKRDAVRWSISCIDMFELLKGAMRQKFPQHEVFTGETESRENVGQREALLELDSVVKSKGWIKNNKWEVPIQRLYDRLKFADDSEGNQQLWNTLNEQGGNEPAPMRT